MQLRPYQLEDLETVQRKYQAGVRRQVVKAATGLGKTVFFSALPDFMGWGDRRLMALVHRDELAEQAADKLRKWNPGKSVGIEMGTKRAGKAQLVVASVATIGRSGSNRIQSFDPRDFSAVITDECHRSTAKSYRNIYDYFRVGESDILSLGVTATPNRADGIGLGEVYDEIVVQRSIRWGINEGWLANLRGETFTLNTDLDKVHIRGGDLAADDLGLAINQPVYNDIVARTWLEKGEDRQTIAFGVDVDHAKKLAEAFKSYGVAAEASWGDDPYRKQKVEAFCKGQLKVLVNCQLYVEGFDVWQVACVVWVRPTQSEGFYTQGVGRGTRIPEGIYNLLEALAAGQEVAKKDCMVLDFVGNSRRHSLLTLGSLFGLSEKANLKGKKITDVLDEVDNLQKVHPSIDIAKITDISKYKVYAEKVDLFEERVPPEIVQLSKFRWTKPKNGLPGYQLDLPAGEYFYVYSSSKADGSWSVRGKLKGNQFATTEPTLEEAIQYADDKVKLFGSFVAKAMASAEAKWRRDPPTAAQLQMAKAYGFEIPPGATKGDCVDLFKRKFAEMRNKKKAA